MYYVVEWGHCVLMLCIYWSDLDWGYGNLVVGKLLVRYRWGKSHLISLTCRHDRILWSIACHELVVTKYLSGYSPCTRNNETLNIWGLYVLRYTGNGNNNVILNSNATIISPNKFICFLRNHQLYILIQLIHDICRQLRFKRV